MKKIKVNLDTKSIDNAIKELEKYKASMVSKSELFIRRLGEHGITVAQMSVTGEMGSLITFTTQDIKTSKDITIGYFVGQNRSKVISQWKVLEDGREVVKSAEISPILMFEFGSGIYKLESEFSEFPSDSPDYKEHVEHGWYYKKLNNRWYHSYGLKPTRPMVKAWEQMKKDIYKVAKEVFSEG